MENPEHHNPPRFAEMLLKRLLADDWETPAGDFEEYYNQLVDADGKRRARRWYRSQVVQLIPGRLLEKTLWTFILFTNNLKVAYRTLMRHPGYAAINIGGLAIGLAACILIALYVRDEMAFDRHWARADQIARILEVQSLPDGSEQRFAYTFNPLGAALEDELPEIKISAAGISRWSVGRQTVQFGENRFYEPRYFYTDRSFFEIFDLEWIAGDPSTALSGPLRVVLTESAAEKYFGDEDPMGKLLSIERDGDYTVVGLIKDPPENSHFNFSMILSLDTLRRIEGWANWMQDWDSQGMITYLLLDEDAILKDVEEGMNRVLASHISDEVMNERSPYLQALSNVHFYSGDVDFDENAGRSSISTVYMFSAIASLILLIASINYTNMAAASSMRRAKEVGLRKSAGANRRHLVRQFLSESILTTAGAMVFAVLIAHLALPLFNTIAGKELSLNLVSDPALALLLLILLFVLGILSGSYPAFMLSRFNPATVLKGTTTVSRGSNRLRRGLVVAQFTLSIGLIIATLVISRQMNYVREAELGFNDDHLVIVDINSGNARSNFESMKRDFASDASVRAVSVSSNVPGDWKNITQIDISAPDVNPDQVITSHFLGVDTDFLDTYEMTLRDGRNFSENASVDSMAVILNESAAERLGAEVGSRVRIPGSSLFNRFADQTFEPTVIGIMNNFNFMSLHESVGPMVLGYHSNPIDVIDYFAVRIEGMNVIRSMDHLRSVGERYDPDHPFEYNFLDERLTDFYESEIQMASIFRISTALAILIACLGLLGLTAYTTVQRNKEIGVRKVLGASVSGILILISRETLALIGISFLIAAPLSYLFMSQWLNRFAFRVSVGPGLFVVALLLAVAFAVITVSYQALRAATADPVESLRYE